MTWVLIVLWAAGIKVPNAIDDLLMPF